jgi:cytochrome c553
MAHLPHASRCPLALTLLAWSWSAVPAPTAPPADAAAEHFERKVRPLFVTHCLKCHGPEKSKGGLRLDSAASLTRGGDSGPAVIPGKPDESLLLRAVRQAGDVKMPPDSKLKDQEIADLIAWVRAGAVWPDGGAAKPVVTDAEAGRTRFTPEQKAFWAFQPVRDLTPPPVRDTAWPTSPLDHFILARLEAKGLSPAPRADRRTLIRRVTFDLTGLPPTPQEIDAFLADASPEAFAKVVDRLLKSPHYGERWARHWLDVVRYADTTANDANAVMRFAYRYRDYVVDAFNRDLPFDQFIVEQLAGDLLPPTGDLTQMASRVIATGFLMVGPKALAETDKEQSRLDVVDDQIDVTGRAFLGLTLGCARCHDHKFDPIPTRDYYSLAGIFRSTEVFQDENRNATMWQEWPLLQLPGEKPLMVMAPKEGRPVDLRVHVRGNRFNPGAPAPRRFLQILAREGHAPLTTSQSGRLELARWIASPKNPLTARVMVNRLWQHHFGTGLVATGDNFGARGERPSHPELLDWLAARFVEGGWSVKAMHRLMLLSSTYQMAGRPDPQALAADPNDRLLWRMPRRRLEAEALRDAVLAASGQLDRAVGGGEGSAFLYAEAEVLDAKRGFAPNRVKSDHPYYTDSVRRSIYLPVVRNMLPDVLALFDAADPNGVTAVRNETTVPSQALFLLNHPFVRGQARYFAQSLLADAKARDEDRVRSAFVRALGRPPSAEETAEAVAHLGEYAARALERVRPEPDVRLAAWQSFCQMLFCSNEFLYVD